MQDEYIRLVDGTPVRYSLAELVADNPSTSFGADFPERQLTKRGVYKAAAVAKPGEFFVRDGYEEVAGAWRFAWRAMTGGEQAAHIAAKRASMRCTMRQAQLALHRAGQLPAVEAAVDAAGGEMAIEWRTASTIERRSPWIADMAAALGLTDGDLDALFTAAMAID